MKVHFNIINFGNICKTIPNGNNKIYEYYDNNNNLIRSIERDEFNRDIDSKTFDTQGNNISHMHKTYEGENIFETYKDQSQEYTRSIICKKIDKYTHRIEKYISKTAPDKNYVTEFIRDMSGKLVRIITNGKIIELK